MSDTRPAGLTPEELEAEEVTALPDKEVVSILDLNADLNLAIDAAAPIDLGVAANANVAAPIDGSVAANVLSVGSDAQSMAHQGAVLNQGIHADATAHSTQGSTIDQTGVTAPAPAATDPAPVDAGTGTAVPDPSGAASGATSSVGNLADGNLLNVNVNLDGKAGIAAPIDGAVAANANVAAPIDASVAANVGTVDSHAVSIAQQDAVINQDIEGSANATTDQTSSINQ